MYPKFVICSIWGPNQLCLSLRMSESINGIIIGMTESKDISAGFYNHSNNHLQIVYFSSLPSLNFRLLLVCTQCFPASFPCL